MELSDKELDDYEIPEVVSVKDIKEREHANRLFAQETDDYSIVFQNKDGSKTMYYFDEPVKYTDENGTVCDKSTKLSETNKDGYAFVSAENDINVYMPEQLDSKTGIIVKSNEYTIEMSPVDSDKANVSDIITEKENKYDEHDIVEYNDVFGNDTAIEYSAQLNGVKENIVLDRYNGKSEFSFDINTNGLSLKDEDGYFSLIDEEKNESVGTVSEVILFDSSNGENTIVPQGYVTGYTAVKNTDSSYTITIALDDEWLENEAVYPVTIDPTIKISTSGSGSSKTILDAPLYSNKSTTNFGSYSTGTVGYQDSTYGAGRLIVRFPGLDSNATYKSLKANEIESAKLYMYEGTGNSGTSTLQVRYSSKASEWAETAPTYANTSANGSIMSTTKISKSGTCAFDFTSLAIASKYSGYDIKKGIVITNANETNASLRRSFYMTEYSSSKPRVVVEWNPLVDGMAYVFKMNNGECIEYGKNNIYTNTASIKSTMFNDKQISYCADANQVWITKKSISGGYLIYTSGRIGDSELAICTTTGSDIKLNACSSETNPYYCWEFEKITSNTYALKNKYSNKWLYKKSDESFGLTDNSANRSIFTKITSNHPSSWDGGYKGQSGTYKVNIIFDNQTDYNKFATSVESWNGICDKISVKAYQPNSVPANGFNVQVAQINFTSNGISKSESTKGKFIPNATKSNYKTSLAILNDDNKKDTLLNETWSNGVIFLNSANNSFNALTLQKQKASLMHEVGHALKLCHSNIKYNAEDKFDLESIMKEDNGNISDNITLYNKSCLIKKWREMP